MKRILCLLLIVMLFSLTSCSHIEDTNGPDDYSLTTLSEENILNRKGSTTTVGTVRTKSLIGGNLKGSYKVSKVSGVSTIIKFECKGTTVKFEIDFTVTSGNAILAVVSDGTIVRKIEANQVVEFEVNNSKDTYQLVIVGESAKANIKYNINYVSDVWD